MSSKNLISNNHFNPYWFDYPLLLCHTYCPRKINNEKIKCRIIIYITITLGIGSMLQHQAVVTSVEMMQQSSFQLLIGTRGGRAEAMTWTAFSFILVMF